MALEKRDQVVAEAGRSVMLPLAILVSRCPTNFNDGLSCRRLWAMEGHDGAAKAKHSGATLSIVVRAAGSHWGMFAPSLRLK